MSGKPAARVTDPTACPDPGHGVNPVASGSPDVLFDGLPAARQGDPSACGGALVGNLSDTVFINGRNAATLGSVGTHGNVVIGGSGTVIVGDTHTPAAFTPPAPLSPGGPNARADKLTAPALPSTPSAPIPGALNMGPSPRNGCIFAKSCVSVPLGSADAGERPEPATNFGTLVLYTLAPPPTQTSAAGSTGAPFLLASATATATAGRTTALGAAGESIAGRITAWLMRIGGAELAGLGAWAAAPVLALWPSDLGDGTLYTPEELAGLQAAATRVRFQFRRRTSGELLVYGIHARPGAGDEMVPVTTAAWADDKQSMVATLGETTIYWTPNNGAQQPVMTTYPGSPVDLGNAMVHPIPDGADSQVTLYPGQGLEDVTWHDTIITFPADSGIPPLYLVFAKPAVQSLEVDVYAAFRGRPRDGHHLDHMPSQAALRQYLRQNVQRLSPAAIKKLLDTGAAVAIPEKAHQQSSETYGGRNTNAKQLRDAQDLRAAVDNNFDAITTHLLELGFTAEQLNNTRERLHSINEKQGWY